MEEKKYLKWYNKIGYGSGDIAGNVVYAFLTSFMMPYLTDSVGLAAGDVYKRQRVWDVDSHIRVSMFDDRIEVVSPGGLPSGITAEEYLSGKLSALRNRNLANVFYRLGFVEIFGTGITRIKQLYTEGLMKPDFEVSENSIKIVLPLFEKDANLTEDEKVIYKLLSKTMLKPISEIAPYIPFGKSKTTKLLKDMGEKGVIAIEGKGRGTKYIIK